MKEITETCKVCGETYSGLDDGCTLEHWPDGVFLGKSWVCQGCIPDGYKFKGFYTSAEHIDYLKNATMLDKRENPENPLWLDNSIQFPRLISEIIAAGLDENQWDSLLDSMDLESDELSELFDRAQLVWERAKANV